MIYWLLVIGLSASVFEVHAKAKHKDMFREVEINTSVSLTHPVMALDVLIDSGKELITLGVDEHAQRWLHLYTFDVDTGQYNNAQALKIPDAISRFDFSQPKDDTLQSIYFLDSHSVYQYDPISNRLVKWLDVKTLFLIDTPDYISRGNFVIELGDKHGLLFPGFESLTYIRQDQQSRVISQQLPVKAFSSIDNNSVRFKSQPYYIVDTNGDGFKDIVIAEQGRLSSFNQQPDMSIDPQPTLISLASDISALEWWYKRDATGEGLSQASLVYRRLSQLRDLNNDGIPDMVVKATQSSGVLDRENNFQVFIGKITNDTLSFGKTPSSLISAEGTLSGFELVDINQDGKLEVMLSGFDIGVSQIIGALLSGSIDQDVYIFAMDDDDVFDKDPSVSKEVELSFSLSSGQTGNPLVKLADVNGDKLKDLVLSTGTDKLKIYMATTGKRRFARRPIKYKTLLPQDASVVEVADLNGDGKDDLVLKYGRLDDESLANKIKLLIAN